MGGGSWTTEKFCSYSTTKSRSVLSDGTVDIKACSAQEVYEARSLDSALNPKNVTRECVDSAEHPETIPVILALDVTGSMGQTAVEVASELNNIMTELYKDVKDVEFMIMGIGDFAYDDAPLQVSQFESDIRIAEQLDKVWFEFGGGGNNFESYTAAWAFGLRQCKLDCWNRGKKGIIITMGDENLNPYINTDRYEAKTGQHFQSLETPELYEQVSEKFDVFHINVVHSRWGDRVDRSSWTRVLGEDNYFSCPVKAVPQTIAEIIKGCANSEPKFVESVDLAAGVKVDENGAITW